MKKIVKKKSFKYIVVFIVQILILISMTIQPIMASMLGKEIIIETKPFDPRDVFKGDYVQLNYEINDIPLNLVDESILKLQNNTEHYSEFEGLVGKPIYVVLKKDKDFYIVDKATLVKPKEGVYLIGKYAYSIWDETKQGNIKGIRVEYTLDKYFVPENTGKDLEEAARNGNVVAKVKVYKGYSVLEEVLPQ
jgi:uncharacterized membrane-anchored protein